MQVYEFHSCENVKKRIRNILIFNQNVIYIKRLVRISSTITFQCKLQFQKPFFDPTYLKLHVRFEREQKHVSLKLIIFENVTRGL